MLKEIININTDLLQKLINDVPAYSGGRKQRFTDAVKKEIQSRDNYSCQLCNRPGSICHHVYPSGPGTVENGIVLCGRCHGAIHQLLETFRGYSYGFGLAHSINQNILLAFGFMSKRIKINQEDVVHRIDKLEEEMESKLSRISLDTRSVCVTLEYIEDYVLKVLDEEKKRMKRIRLTEARNKSKKTK